MKYYIPKYVQFNLEDQTRIFLHAEDENYSNKNIARFNFLSNEGWYYTLEGKQIEVKRFSTIMNYFFKINENFGWDDKLVEQAKLNAKQIKLDETKQYNSELKEKSEQKAIHFINDFLTGEQAEKLQAMELEELKTMVKNTFKYASKKTLKLVLDTILNYNIDPIVESYNTPIETVNTEVVAHEIITPIKYTYDSVESFTVNSNTFDSYRDAFNHAMNKRIPTTHILPVASILDTVQLRELHSKLSISPSSLTLDELYTFSNHVNSLPVDMDSENATIKLNIWIERKEQQAINIQTEKDRQYNIAKQSYELVESMKTKGLKSIDNDSGWIYEYKGIQYKLLSSMGGTTNEKYSQFINDIYNECFAEMDGLIVI